jgi:hypothetical protein
LVHFAKRLMGLTADVFLPVWSRHTPVTQDVTQSAQSVSSETCAMMTTAECKQK